MNPNDMPRDGELLCRTLAGPDLMGVPVYVIPQSRLPEELGKFGEALGYTYSGMDRQLQDYIDDWRGRGPCMVINDWLFRWLFKGRHDMFYGIVAHELAHILLRDRPYCAPIPDDCPPETIREQAVATAKAVAGTRERMDRTFPWIEHTAPYFRMAYHLWYRANKRGLLDSPDLVIRAEGYGLSPSQAYVEALGTEPADMAEASLRDLRNIPQPEAFSRLWSNDVTRWANLNLRKEIA